MSPIILWFRQDLRLHDNPALTAAWQTGRPIVPVYIWDSEGEGQWAPGGASRWWLHHSLASLAESIGNRGGQLRILSGNTEAVLAEMLSRTGANAVYWNRRYEPSIIARDKQLKSWLTGKGCEVKSFNAALLHEPHTVSNKQGKPFQVFTPYWKHCLTLKVEEPIILPEGKWPVAEVTGLREMALDGLGLLPRIPWDKGFYREWKVGEQAAQRQLEQFVSERVEDYGEKRDFPAVTGTSRLSPYLHFGEIGPRQIWHRVRQLGAQAGVFPANRGSQVFLSEVGWREFAYHLLYHFPNTPEKPLREEFAAFPWAEDTDGVSLQAWQKGRTGYPIVDAGMRELWTTGWMHNRVRMIVASFLVKHLRLPWQQGANWFWDTLVDADLAANTLGWQWSAGCGADAAPYFRVFNPFLQGVKFDGEGAYVRRWVPELARMPDKYLHTPWEAPSNILEYAGVTLGENYPLPMVDHNVARQAALSAFEQLRRERDHP